MSKKIGLIVDGMGDYAAFRKCFKDQYKILKTDGPRGHSTPIENIINRSKKQVAMLNAYKCNKAIIVLDFEMRNIAYSRFIKSIETLLDSKRYDIPVYVAVPNRMIENWYLSDIEILSKKKSYIKDKIKQKKYEGKDGKKELKKCFVRKFTYQETKHGPELFAIIRFDVARKNSPSFDTFLNLLNN
jgi:uncharacterized protein DUF4276